MSEGLQDHLNIQLNSLAEFISDMTSKEGAEPPQGHIFFIIGPFTVTVSCRLDTCFRAVTT